MRTIDIHEAKTHLFDLVEQAARGESFLIATSGTPRVIVLPLESRQATLLRRVGLLEQCLLPLTDTDPSEGSEIERLCG